MADPSSLQVFAQLAKAISRETRVPVTDVIRAFSHVRRLDSECLVWAAYDRRVTHAATLALLPPRDDDHPLVLHLRSFASERQRAGHVPARETLEAISSEEVATELAIWRMLALRGLRPKYERAA